jgi:purine-nucleoside phosphorylase
MRAVLSKVDSAAEFVRRKTKLRPRIAVILGSGLGSFVDSLKVETSIPYGELPHGIRSNVVGHSGRLVVGSVDDVPLYVFQGRVHFYEGHSMEDVAFLSRTAVRLGVSTAIITNAAGAVNTSFRPGDLMLISDHLNLMGANPLIGLNCEELGPRFPDMTAVYPESLRAIARKEAEKLGLHLQEGVYLALSGPTYETPAEVRMLRVLGADATGMSTVPEAIVFSHARIPVLGISCITNMAAGILPQKLHHDEVLETTTRIAREFTALLGATAKAIATEIAKEIV